MPTLKLSFNQKVAFGFAVILLLLTISGAMSLWTLSDISSSNERVHETAVPVVSEVNKVQIRLLKLANLSALGFNALSEEDIRPYRDDFEKGATEFAEGFKTLETLAQADLALAFYNPISRSRPWQLGRALEIVRQHRTPSTPVVLGRDIGRPGQTLRTLTLGALTPDQVDMRTMVLVGSSTTCTFARADGGEWVYTPLWYGAGRPG